MAFLGRVLTVPDVRERRGNKYMKLSTICKNLLPGLALFLAASAFAANNVNKSSVKVFEPQTIR
jgi:hypothetical protein